jgi:hypothetical protein
MEYLKMITKNTTMRNLFGLIFIFSIYSSSLFAQSEEALKKYFEGKMVVVKIDMPATQAGVNVYPLKDQPINFEKYGNTLKKYGTSIYSGDRIMVTKVKMKGKHIEFQLNGGGYGTFGDESAHVSTPNVSKTKREKNLEQEVKREKDSKKKKKLREELDDLKKERELEQKKLHLEAEQQSEQKKALIRDKASQAGSRFNIRFDRDLTNRDRTPQAILEALAEFVDFAFLPKGEDVADENLSQSKTLRKGLLWEEVAQIMGMPNNISERMEGTLKVVSCSFEKKDQKVNAEFVEGVLIKYSIVSK